jgi:hypothetical protein
MIRQSIVLLALFISSSALSTDPRTAMVEFLKEYLSIKYNGIEFDRFVYIAAKNQKLYLIDGDAVIAEYSVSTAVKGVGSELGSFKTPTGLHKVAEKIGDGVELYGIFKQKVFTGSYAEPIAEERVTNEDLITTRILHLRGEEEGLNKGSGVDSYERGIFIHGTHEEGLIGQAASKGCVRMRNEEMLSLYREIEVGTFVVILNN